MVSTATWRYLRWSIATIVFIFVLLSLRVFTPPRSRYVRYRNPWLQSRSRGLSYDPLIPNLRKKCSCSETVFKDIPDADNMVWTGKCSFLMHQNNYFEFQRIVVVPISSWCIRHGINEKIFFLRESKQLLLASKHSENSKNSSRGSRTAREKSSSSRCSRRQRL